MLKWIVIYNSSFSNNHKDLFDSLKQFENEGKLKLYRQCDYINTIEDVNKLFNVVDDITELLTHKTIALQDSITINKLKEDIIKNPKKKLKSVISLWYLEEIDEYTRVDIGEVELKYIIEHEKRNPKWI